MLGGIVDAVSGVLTGDTGKAIGGALGAAGLDFLAGKSLQDDAQSFQRQVLQNSMRWRMADLEAAGLNPILAGGVNSPAGAAGGIANNPGIANNVNSALAAKKLKKELAMLDANTYNATSQGLAAQGVEAYNHALAGKARTEQQILENTSHLMSEAQRDYLKTPEGRDLAIMNLYTGDGGIASTALGLTRALTGIGRGIATASKPATQVKKTFNTFNRNIRNNYR